MEFILAVYLAFIQPWKKSIRKDYAKYGFWGKVFPISSMIVGPSALIATGFYVGLYFAGYHSHMFAPLWAKLGFDIPCYITLVGCAVMLISFILLKFHSYPKRELKELPKREEEPYKIYGEPNGVPKEEWFLNKYLIEQWREDGYPGGVYSEWVKKYKKEHYLEYRELREMGKNERRKYLYWYM